MKKNNEIVKRIGKIILVLILVFVAVVIINRVSFTDKLLSEIYLLRFGTDTEYVGEEMKWSSSFFTQDAWREKTYYDKKYDFEFHIRCGNELFTNRVTGDDYYQSKLRKEAEDILIEEVIKPVLENDYFVVVKGFRDATKKNTLENTVTIAYIFTWAEGKFDDIGQKVMEKVKNNSKIKKGKGIQLFICEDAKQYSDEKNIIEKQDEEEMGYGMQWYVPDDETILYNKIIHCYDMDDKWLNAR